MDSSSLKGKLVLSSGLLDSSWSKISELHESCLNQKSGVRIRIYPQLNHTLVVFATTQIHENSSKASSTLLSGSHNTNPFHFLCSEKISSFSLHTQALKLFVSTYNSNANDNLHDLKSKVLNLLKSKKPVIITGASLGGSVASLFTLWLLETIDPKLNRPLCITFGSPLIGDDSLQQILENSIRNSCFLHVTEAEKTPISTSFKPFGTFLICFGSKCICIEDPEAVMELIVDVNMEDLIGWRDYKEVLDRLDQSVLSTTDSRLMIDDVMNRMEERAEKKKLRYDQLKKLNDMKISMVYIEWYKRKSKKDKIGYYDRYKTQLESPFSPVDMDIEKRKKELNDYWKTLVEEVEKKPQSETSVLKTRCLFSGNNYRRMVEPLDIAEYYLNGRTEYRISGRSRHYVMLEKWFKEEALEPFRCEKSDLSELLTFDSCFWAEVEEAMIVMNQLKNTQVGMMMRDEELIGKVVKFEEYVWRMIGKREVSPEIFLEKSSFMKWWKEYKEMKVKNGFDSSSSQFNEFMNKGMYERYGQFKVD